MWSKLRLFDWTIAIVPLLLILFGTVVIYTITFPTVQFALARSQIIYAILGIIVALVLVLIDYRTWQSLAIPLYIAGLILLILVIFIGSRQFGAARWIDLGVFQLQPSEIFKFALIVFLARFLALWHGQMTVWRLILLLILAFIPVGIVFKQPDLGTASVLFVITFGLLVFARLPWRWWVAILGIGLLLLPLGYSQLEDYQRSRIRTFLSPESDPSGQGYNVKQAKIAIGSGGLFGQGLGQGSQSQLNFLPVAHTDFIFAGLAEATGLLGCSILLGLYLVLTARLLKIAELAKDLFGMYVVLGVTIMIVFQLVVNTGMNLGLLPVTGIPLPFVSSGGTSLIISLASIGLVQSIYARHKKISF